MSKTKQDQFVQNSPKFNLDSLVNTNKPNTEEFNFDILADNWTSGIVARSEVGRFSGGLLHPRTMANLDSLGTGAGKIMVGNRACYSTRKLISWMKARQHK
jgi:hypothetical protein